MLKSQTTLKYVNLCTQVTVQNIPTLAIVRHYGFHMHAQKTGKDNHSMLYRHFSYGLQYNESFCQLPTL